VLFRSDLAGTAIDGMIGRLLQEQLLVGRAALQVTISDEPGVVPRPFWVLW
jgi:hypothetical protein